MSDPAIYIELRGTTRHVPPRYIRPRPPRPRSAVPNHMVRYSGSPIRHTEFGIRNSEIEIRNPEKRQIMVRSAAFRSNPRKHWPESGSQEIFMVRYFPS